MITARDQVVDWDLEFLASIAGLLDLHLDEVDRMAEKVPDPDACGVYDHCEEVYGIGFVMCQRYLAAIYGSLGVKKTKALAYGRRLASQKGQVLSISIHDSPIHLPEGTENIKT